MHQTSRRQTDVQDKHCLQGSEAQWASLIIQRKRNASVENSLLAGSHVQGTPAMLAFSERHQSSILHIKVRAEPWGRKWLAQNHTAEPADLAPRYPDSQRGRQSRPILSLQTHGHVSSKGVCFRAETTNKGDSKTGLIPSPQSLTGGISIMLHFLPLSLPLEDLSSTQFNYIWKYQAHFHFN